MAGVLTWGNLYLIQNEAVNNNELAAFGEQAVPGKIFNLVKDSNDIMKMQKQLIIMRLVMFRRKCWQANVNMLSWLNQQQRLQLRKQNRMERH